MKNSQRLHFFECARQPFIAALLVMACASSNAVELADAPLFSTVTVPGNLALTLSVEWPTATTPAYTIAYDTARDFLGYFDPGKCYKYNYVAGAPATSYFSPVGPATASHQCAIATATSQLWSGNYLNWASMQTLDTFRWVLTGGYRSTDTSTETRLTKTYAARDSNNPNKSLGANISTSTPFGWNAVKTRVRNLGTAMRISQNGNVDSAATADYNGQYSTNAGNAAYANPNAIYLVYINVKVCDSTVGLESNCVAYRDGYKPEGLLQKYSQKLRYSAFGYYNDGRDNPQRDGAILRARMKYIAPTQPVPGSAAIPNTNGEWNAITGVMVTNPDPNDAASTVTDAAAAGWDTPIVNSGVMNYLNKFGYSAKNYKGFDPVSELYYTAIRYFKKLGNVDSYTTLTGAGNSATAALWLDGFPAIRDWYGADGSQDPILYSCQSNFVLGIGDVYSHRDANLPGSSLTSANEPPVNAAITADTTVNVTTATNMIGQLEGFNNLGATWTNCSGSRGNTFYIAGLAYDSHTRDIRADWTGKQTINTYWMDVHENVNYCHKNQYWLAAKYGGFKVSDSFDPYAATNSTASILQNEWYSSADTLPFAGTNYQASLAFTTDAVVNTSDKRPDNYFPGNSPATMKSGLEGAFAKIVAEASEATSTGVSTPTPRQAASGNANYSIAYSPTSWTSTLLGQLISFGEDGTPTTTNKWDATSLLDTRTSANRLVVTCCTNIGAAFPFTDGNITGTARNSLSVITGVTDPSHSVANYILYLRGDRTNELTATSGFYRQRAHLLGDVVNSKLATVGAPDFPFFDLYNPGYSEFKSARADRPTVVYVGANDGMMHAFDGTVVDAATCISTLTTPSNACGKELFAYIPSFVFGDATTGPLTGLASLGTPSSFVHHFMVDATPVISDVDFFNTPSPTALTNDWRTLLVGGLGKGGKGYYAIDVTDPSAWTSEANVASKVLWEFTNSHMGYSFGDPVIVKTPEYGWTVILASGFNNDDGIGYLFLINPRDGSLLRTIALPEGSVAAPLNLAHVTAYAETYQDQKADALYAGDLQGNVWRVDLTPSRNATTVAGNTTITTSHDYNIVKIASVKDSLGNPQPITTKPLVEIEPSSGKRFVMVGTGQLLSDSDVGSTQRQAFYAINDGLKQTGKFYASLLTSNSGDTVTEYSGVATPNWDDPETADTTPVPVAFPITRSSLVDNTDLTIGISSSETRPMGWYYDLAVDAVTGIAERVNVQPTATSDGIVGFAANLPNGNACSPAGVARVFAISFGTGLSAIQDSFGNIQAFSNLTSNVTDLTFLNVQGKTRLFAGTGSGAIIKVGTEFPGSTSYKRLNWREVPSAD